MRIILRELFSFRLPGIATELVLCTFPSIAFHPSFLPINDSTDPGSRQAGRQAGRQASKQASKQARRLSSPGSPSNPSSHQASQSVKHSVNQPINQPNAQPSNQASWATRSRRFLFTAARFCPQSGGFKIGKLARPFYPGSVSAWQGGQESYPKEGRTTLQGR